MCHLAVEGEEAIVEHLRGLGGPSEAKYVCWLDSTQKLWMLSLLMLSSVE